jgi:DnaJ-class molecular chaperone
MNPYHILELKKEDNPSSSTIRKAYYKLAKKYHPDKNESADENKFKEVSRAYEILSDPKKKEKYDRFGITDDDANNANHIDPMEMFQRMFAGNSPFGMNFGNGGSFHFMGRMPNQNLRRNGGFPFGGMMGLQPGSRVTINGKECVIGEDGNPIERANDIIENIPLSFSELYNGKKITVRNKFRVTIEPGVLFGKKFTFKGKGEKEEGKQNGDLIINIVPSRDDPLTSIFQLKRDGSLVYKKDISIIESLTGIHFRIPHPSGKNITIKQESIIQYDEPVRIIENKGMPIQGHENTYSPLIIHYNIIYNNISNEVINHLKRIHPYQKLERNPTDPEFTI